LIPRPPFRFEIDLAAAGKLIKFSASMSIIRPLLLRASRGATYLTPHRQKR
jgi:hypothetical protein